MKLRKEWTAGLLAGLAAVLLAGCGRDDTASLMIDGNDTALTLERVKPYVWSDEWDLDLVVRRFPDCQRRHKLNPARGEAFKMDVFAPEPGVFIVKQGKRWYVTQLKDCDLQAFKEAPPEPGTPVGSFAEKDGVLKFVKAPAAGS
ncbi:MAG: hypothetical protein PHY45_01455 [Rhodocyclaceae bacterium]|nr:hypothetical protein [Rhodocyclaceae bacterium]